MKKLIAFFPIFTFVIILFTYGQNTIEGFVKANTVQIKSIDPDSFDFSDLEIIGNAVGDAKIIMLGEQDHGDAATFLAKTRLIKYLHEKKGVNVLAFESDFFSLNYNWDRVLHGNFSADSIKRNIWSIWSFCTAMNNLFNNYIPDQLKNQNPLHITGFDNQMSSVFLLPLLDSVLQSTKIPIVLTPEYQNIILPLLNNWYSFTKDTIATDKIIGYYKQIKSELLTQFLPDNFWIQVIDNLIVQNQQFRNWKKDYWKDTNVRDRQMALNIKWLADIKYPTEKIIIWAHNYHISKYGGHYPEDFMNNATTMGTVLTSDTSFLNKTYVLGFTSYEGIAGRLPGKLYNIKNPGKNSVESWINSSYDFAFLDFTKFNALNQSATEPFSMSGSVKTPSLHTNHKAEWNKIFDGVFYIKKMFPCER